MPAKRTKTDVLQVTLDPLLSRHVAATLVRFGFQPGKETEYVRHIVRAWLSRKGILDDIAFPPDDPAELGK